ncbi:MAG TPA: hypothetical protein ENI15_15675 [Spirochaetes bacterium]|nr:hypothetical protein [Spirochaetota bacterium]
MKSIALKTKLFKAADFIAKLTLHIPPKHKHLIRYYGVNSIYLKDAWRDEILYSLFCLKIVASGVFPAS